MAEIRAVIPVLGKTFPIMDVGTKRKQAIFILECTRCRGCELACSVFREGKNNPALSRIRIKPKEAEWMEGTVDRIVERRICRQCPGTSLCMQACPVEGVIYRDNKTGAVIVNEDKCIRCRACVKACPYGAIWYNKRADKILKCDLCGGTPKCVEWCPIKALKYENVGGHYDDR